MTASYAIFMCGNAGVGKSTLSNLLGAEFDAGFSIGEGLTRKVSTHLAVFDNQDQVLLIDAPGMYEASDEQTQQNAKQIQTALGYDAPYKIAFVISSNAGRLLSQDIALIDKVVESLRSSESGTIEYVLIINQIPEAHMRQYSDQNTLDLIETKLRDATKTKPIFSTIVCCPIVEDPANNADIRKKLIKAFEMKRPNLIRVISAIEACLADLKEYATIIVGGIAVVAMMVAKHVLTR